jgi:alpha-beta hydrolase superfamily lysophospholipase
MRQAGAAVRVPVLLMLAEHDRIIDNGRTREYLNGVASGDKTVIDFAGAHHTLEFEPDPTPVFDALTTWLTSRLRTPTADAGGSPPAPARP